MIFIMSQKQWDKYKKKLVQHKGYIIMDGTEDDDARMNRYTNTITMDAFCPPTKLLKLMSEGTDIEDIIDIDRLEELEKNYFNGLSLRNAVLATVSGLINQNTEDINIFIVLRNKAFKYYRKKFRKLFIQLFDPNFEFVFILEDDYKKNRKALDRDLKNSEKEELAERLKKLEDKMAEDFEKKKQQKLGKRKKKK